MAYSKCLDAYGNVVADLVRRDDDQAIIPADPNNLDYRVFEAWLAEGNTLCEPPELPLAVPATVEDWQFAGQAAVECIITRAEALDWSGAGVVPPSLVAAVDRLITDADQHFDVMIFLRGSKSYPRRHALVPLLGRVFGKDSEAKLDAFWIAAGGR